MSVYWPTGHFGQDSALGIIQEVSGVVASGSESFRKVPGLQQNIRLIWSPGSTRLLLCKFQLGLHHTPWMNDGVYENMFATLVTLDTSHAERSELKEVALLNVFSNEVTLDTSHVERSELKELWVS